MNLLQFYVYLLVYKKELLIVKTSKFYGVAISTEQTNNNKNENYSSNGRYWV